VAVQGLLQSPQEKKIPVENLIGGYQREEKVIEEKIIAVWKKKIYHNEYKI
jgi:hypothetical protein